MAGYKFPKEFIWGAATSSYQIEGASDVDGKGESIWDAFTQTPGNIADKSNGNVACDHYNLWREDIELMRKLKLQAYRFSISWPRILPSGTGKINTKGLDFYSRLADGLLEAGIDPWVTLYHWDLPQTLQKKGGWSERDIVSSFCEYSSVVANHLGDRVKNWITINEPWVISVLGHLEGHHAPGLKDHELMLKAAHHLLLAHGRSVKEIRKIVPNSRVGITLNLCPAYTDSGESNTQDSARVFDGTFNRWYLDPLYKGCYPEDIISHYKAEGLGGNDMSFVKPGDLEDIRAETDFLGINYYTRALFNQNSKGEDAFSDKEKNLSNVTDMGWEVYPEGLKDLLIRVEKDYGPKAIYITENGAAYDYGPDKETSKVQDTKRIDYLKSHIESCRLAVDQGVPLKGYFVWSLLDNFEWAYGYEKRFGIVWVDYKTMQRIPKESAYWYQKHIESENGR